MATPDPDPRPSLTEEAVEHLRFLVEMGSGGFISRKTHESISALLADWERIRCLAALPEIDRLHLKKLPVSGAFVGAFDGELNDFVTAGWVAVVGTRRFQNGVTATVYEVTDAGRQAREILFPDTTNASGPKAPGKEARDDL